MYKYKLLLKLEYHLHILLELYLNLHNFLSYMDSHLHLHHLDLY
jgi:hypothetical protein